MALVTYTDLQTAVALWLARAGDTNITANAPDFITLCESRIAYGSDDPEFPSEPLRIRGMEQSVTLVIGAPAASGTVGGTANAITFTPTVVLSAYTNGLLYQFTATASNTGAVTLAVSGLTATAVVKGSSRLALAGNEILNGGTYNVYYDGINSQWILMPDEAHIPLPANYLAMRTLWFYDGTLKRPIPFMPPQAMNSIAISNQQGPPRGYTIIGDAIRLVPDPDATYYAPCDYYQKFPALVSAAGATNWLMTNHPGVYLNGTLLEASIFTGNIADGAKYARLYGALCNALQRQDERDRHSGAALTITNSTGNP